MCGLSIGLMGGCLTPLYVYLLSQPRPLDLNRLFDADHGMEIKVTLGLVLIGAVPPMRGLLVFPCQVLAGIAAAGVVSALFPGPLLVNVSLGAGTSVVQGLFIEMLLTIQFLVVIFMLAVEKHRATFLAPLGIGLTLFICHMTGQYTSCLYLFFRPEAHLFSVDTETIKARSVFLSR